MVLRHVGTKTASLDVELRQLQTKSRQYILFARPETRCIGRGRFMKRSLIYKQISHIEDIEVRLGKGYLEQADQCTLDTAYLIGCTSRSSSIFFSSCIRFLLEVALAHLRSGSRR